MKRVIKNFPMSALSKCAVDGKQRVVTVVGQLEQTRDRLTITEPLMVEAKPFHYTEGVVMFQQKSLHRKLTLGLSICHPDDTPNNELGERTALRHIREGKNVGVLETHCANMLTDDNIMANVESKLKYVCENIDKFINR